LLARQVTPVEKAPVLPVQATGLILNTGQEIVYNDEQPIPLNEGRPAGLFFRVQIGAFSKPVPNNTFTEFAPVSGEEVRPGLIRYMAGYFGGRSDAETARDAIRRMGYSDAFVVAYCDGERIPVYRAEQLIASGACVPTISTPEKAVFTSEEAEGLAITSGGGFKEELDEYAYNKAPGAAEAEAAETKMGLYFTVQVGVYNRPVSAAQLKNISPLVTKRLPNGQLRYSSGMFDNVPDAQVKRTEAVNLGISDAFIVAYYQGERITVAQARKLLEENGETILESKQPTVRKRNDISSSITAPKPDPEPVLKDKNLSIQLVSKDMHQNYPAQLLHRYNENGGLFYYDESTQSIRSLLYPDNAVPAMAIIRGEFEEVLYYSGYKIRDPSAIEWSQAVANSSDTLYQLSINIRRDDLTDDLFREFLQAPLLKSLTLEDAGVRMLIMELGTSSNLEKLQIMMARLGATEISFSATRIEPTSK
jgi:hypothetical protein